MLLIGGGPLRGCSLPKRRWAIELFFPGIEQTLGITRFPGTFENAVRIQVACALIAFPLLRPAQAATQAAQATITSPLAFARLVRGGLMHLRRLADLARLLPRKRPEPRPSPARERPLPCESDTKNRAGQPWDRPGHDKD